MLRKRTSASTLMWSLGVEDTGERGGEEGDFQRLLRHLVGVTRVRRKSASR